MASEKVNHEKTRQDLEQQIASLTSQLQAEKESAAELATNAKAQLNTLTKTKDAKLKDLERSNKELCQKRKRVQKELVSCATDNDKLRSRLVSLANETNKKDQTLSTALSQLKSLSETYYSTEQSLKREEAAHRDDVASLQWSLDDMSRQMLLLTEKVHELQNDNIGLRNELKRQKLEKQRSTTFRRGARGA